MSVFNGDLSWEWDNLDHASAADLLAGNLPGADHDRLEPFGYGDFCLAFKLGKRVVRVARHLEASAALRRETCTLMDIAAKLPLPVPRLSFYSPPGCPPFTIHDEITGAILTREDWENMPLLMREKAAGDLAIFLRALHELPVEPGLQCRLAQLSAAVMAQSLREAVANTIGTLLDRETQQSLNQTLERWALPSPPDEWRPVLLHCDIGPGHLLYDPLTGSLTGVIDFGDIAVGEPARDFIYIYEDFGPVILGEVLRRYVRDNIPGWMAAIRKWYLLEAISWTVDMFDQQQTKDLEHGLGEIKRELALYWTRADG